MTESQDTEAKKEKEVSPKWSLKTVFWTFFSIILVSSLLVLLLVKKELWVEIEIILSVIATLMFLFYWWVLYHGVRFKDDEHLSFSLTSFDIADPGADPGVGFGEITASGADDPFGLILAFFLDLFVCFVLVVVLSVMFWIGVNVLLLAVLMIATPLFYVFRSSVSFVLKNSPKCKGDLVKAALYSAYYTTIKTTWFFLVVAGVHFGKSF